MILLTRSKLISINILICKVLIYLVISNDEFILKQTELYEPKHVAVECGCLKI